MEISRKLHLPNLFSKFKISVLLFLMSPKSLYLHQTFRVLYNFCWGTSVSITNILILENLEPSILIFFEGRLTAPAWPPGCHINHAEAGGKFHCRAPHVAPGRQWEFNKYWLMVIETVSLVLDMLSPFSQETTESLLCVGQFPWQQKLNSRKLEATQKSWATAH